MYSVSHKERRSPPRLHASPRHTRVDRGALADAEWGRRARGDILARRSAAPPDAAALSAR